MRITEHEISVFLWGAAIGAAIGSIITYLNTTREKRIVSRVRHDIDNLGGFLFDELTPAQCKRTRYPNAELVSDKQILEIHRWAEQWKKYRKSYNFRPSAYARFDSRENKISPTLLAAEVIICEELLGLSADDAIIACLRFKSLDDLKTLRNKDKEEADKRKKEAEAYEENYQRQWRGFKKRVFEGLSAIARGEKVRLDPETVEAAKGLMAYMGYKSESQDPESKKWTALLDDLSADALRDAKAIQRRIDEILFPDALEDFEDDKEIMKRFIDHTEKINRGESVRLDPEIEDGIRKIGERKRRNAKWESDTR